MRRLAPASLLASALALGCAAHHPSTRGTLADLRKVEPDVQDVTVDQGLEQAMAGYRRFLEETPQTAMTPEAIRRLADLQLEKQFGIHTGETKARPMTAPVLAQPAPAQMPGVPGPPAPAGAAGPTESEREFEQRTTAMDSPSPAGDAGPGAASSALEAIALYDRLLQEYPEYENSDQVLYQKARAYDELGRTEEAMETMDKLIKANPHSAHYDEVQFRRGEYFFMRRHFRDAENAYSAIIKLGTASSYYELALYKLGWAFYKQDLYEEALQQYLTLLDYKVTAGYDFDQTHEEEEERRVSDTFRVISLSFSYLGGPEPLAEFFSKFGHRDYEDRIYGNLAEHYLGKLRYDDAAKTYKTFMALYPFHPAAPRFGMKVIETFTQGGFPMLVLEAKREFASTYALKAEYWRHVKLEDSPEVLAYLKTNLKDLAAHYHAQYRDEQHAEEKPANYREALHWYSEYLDSFPADAEAPSINYRLADLLLENKDFGEAARQYERTAYGYPAHPQSAAAGYAAVYAYREELAGAAPGQQDAVKQAAIASSIKFVDTFPEHEHAAAVLGAAADDQFEMKDYQPAVATARRLIEAYPSAEAGLRRSAWTVVAHSSFELAEYPAAESAYGQVLSLTPEDDEGRPALVDNLAASIYKQGELANQAQDYRAAADHFLRIRTVAPTSTIRATAEYDAGAALIRLEDWTAAAEVLEGFRRDFPQHELQLEATRQIALSYREAGQLSRAAEEYQSLATQSPDEAIRRESLLMAGDLFQQSSAPGPALEAYRQYVQQFPQPIEPALETHSKIAEILKASGDPARYRQELAEIVRLDAAAGPERTARTRTLAGRSALVLAEQVYQQFVVVKLTQPFEASLQEKKQRLDATIEAMDSLVSYEIGEVTAAATYYMAETYFNFSRALADSERPTDLSPAEMQEYERVLEEEAFPFEEKAIQFHRKNQEMLQGGTFNAWIEKSLGRLAELMPGRYAKPELSSGFLDALDRYVYRSPGAPPPGTPPVPGAGNPSAPPSPDGAPETSPAPPEEAPAAVPPPPAAEDSGGEEHPNER